MRSTRSDKNPENRGSGGVQVVEALVLAIVCVAPWMIGAVPAWAELVLIVWSAGVAIVATISGRNMYLWRNLTSLPSLGLGGLVLLGLAQSTPIPARVLAVLDPNAAALRSEFLPEKPENFGFGSSESVAIPPPTLSQEPNATRDSTGRLIASWLLLQTVMGMGPGYKSLRRFGWGVALNATLLALFSVIQAFAWNGKLYWVIPLSYGGTATSVGGPFVCHTHLAEYLNVGLGFALGFLLGAVDERKSGTSSNRVMAAYVVAVLALGIITSNSRGGFLGMLVSAFFTVMCLRSRRFRFWAGLGAGVLMVAVFLAALGDITPYLERLSTITNSSNEAYRLRPDIWRDVLRGWLKHPLFGSGLGTFGTSASAVLVNDIGGYAAHAENEYVEVLFTGGLVGFVLGVLGLVGVSLRARRAWVIAPTSADRVLVLGAFAGIVALSSQLMSDFGVHIPAVSLLLVVVCGHLSRLGGGLIEETPSERQVAGFVQLLKPLTCGAVAVLLGSYVIAGAVQRFRCESLLASVGLPAPDSDFPTPALQVGTLDELELRRSAQEQILLMRPDWTEGHLRLGLTNLALYVATADEWLTDSVSDPVERAELADPLWLLTLIREGKADTATLQELEPVRRFLIPAARNFMDARRCCLVSALAEAELGALSCLFKPNPTPSPYVERALSTSGGNTDVIAYAGAVALKSGELALAARCWKRVLHASDGKWAEVADAAGSALSPTQILESVIPDDRGRYALMFAERLYVAPKDQPSREDFLRRAVLRLPKDLDLPEPERLWLQGRAYSLLDDRVNARRIMSRALELNPNRLDWRKELIEGLIRWGDPEEAHQLAILGQYLAPRNADAQKLIDLTRDAVARGANAVESGHGGDPPC